MSRADRQRAGLRFKEVEGGGQVPESFADFYDDHPLPRLRPRHKAFRVGHVAGDEDGLGDLTAIIKARALLAALARERRTPPALERREELSEGVRKVDPS
jgi:hypothetical protein